MHIPFDTLPATSRVWVYQANRTFLPEERTVVEKSIQALCDQWAAHGTPLHTSFKICYDQFVILAVDEQHHGPSGCSIDSSVHALTELQQRLRIDFFDRTLIAFLQGDHVVLYNLRDLKTFFENHALTEESISFNNTVTTKESWELHWKVPVRESWLARYLPKSAVAP